MREDGEGYDGCNKSGKEFEYILAVIAICFFSGVIAIILFIKKDLNKGEQALRKQQSISLPLGNFKNPVLAYADEYITVKSNPTVGPMSLTQGIWLIEKIEKEGQGSILLRGQRRDSDGGTTRVTLNLTIKDFEEKNAGMDYVHTPKNSKKFPTVRSAFGGDDQIARDEK